MRKWLWITVTIVLFIFLIGGSVYSFIKKKGGEKEEETLKPVRGDIAKSVLASGSLNPFVFVEVKSKASGIVEKIYVETGEWVEKGHLLAELDKKQLSARLEQAEANLSAAEASLARVKRGATPLQLSQAEEAVSRARVALDAAERTFQRVSELYQKGFASREEFDTAKSQRDLAQKDLEASEKSLSVLKSLPLPEEVKEAEAAVRQGKAVRDDAAEELRNASVYSPMEGVVLARFVEEGSAVASATMSLTGGTVMFVVGDVSRMEFKGQVDEADVGLIKTGLPVELTVDAYPKEKFVGNLQKIEPRGVEKGGVVTFGITVELENPAGKLLANMTANAHIILDKHTNALLVPVEAVKFDKDKAYVFKVTKASRRKKTEKVEIQAGYDDGVHVEVLGGLTESDEILAKAPKEKKSIFD